MTDAIDPLSAAAAAADADDAVASSLDRKRLQTELKNDLEIGAETAAVVPASPELTLAGSRRFDYNSTLASFGGDDGEVEVECDDGNSSDSDVSVTKIVAKSTVLPQQRDQFPPPLPPPPPANAASTASLSSSADRIATRQETNDLFVTVDDPIKKVTAMEAFVLYRVTTNGTRPEIADLVHIVRRRFTDFSRLRAALADAWPGRVLPPLPEKHPLATIDRFDTRFLHRRARALQRFIGRLADNAVLSAAPVFVSFLTSTDCHEFERQCKLVQQQHQLSSMLPQLLLSKGRRPAQSLRPEFAAADRAAAGVGRLFGRFEKASDRLAGELRGLATEEAALAEALYSLQLAEKAWTADGGGDSDSRAVEDLRRAAKAASDGVRAAEDLAEFAAEEVGQPMHEYLLYSGCVRSCLARASGLQSQAQSAKDNLHQFQQQQQQQQSGQSSASIAERLAELSSRSDRLSDIASAACADLTADLDRWRLDRRQDTRTLLHGLAAAHTNRLTATAEAWAAAAAAAALVGEDSAASPTLAARRRRPQPQRLADDGYDDQDDEPNSSNAGPG